MAGPSIIVNLAFFFACVALAVPFDLQELSHLSPRHHSPGSNPPFPLFNPQAGHFPHGEAPIPTGTAIEPSKFVGPTGTAAPVPTGLMKRDHFPKDFHPAPSGVAPSGFMPHPTGFPAPTGGSHDFEPPFMHHHQARQFDGVRKHGFKPFFPAFAPGPEIPFPSGTMPPMPTAT